MSNVPPPPTPPGGSSPYGNQGGPQSGPPQQPGYGQAPPPQQPGYGQGPASQHPAGPAYGAPGSQMAPPKKSGVPVWAWILGGLVGLLLLCCCGFFALGGIGALQSETSSTTSAQTSDPTEEPTTEPTTSEPTTSEPTTTSTSTSTSTSTTTSTPSPTTPAVPPKPAGSTANTDSSQRLSSDKLQSEIARGYAGTGINRSSIKCNTGITLIAGRKATCKATNPITKKQNADVDVEVAWAQVTKTSTTRRIQWYLTFNIEG